jgi:hypothetical protein
MGVPGSIYHTQEHEATPYALAWVNHMYFPGSREGRPCVIMPGVLQRDKWQMKQRGQHASALRRTWQRRYTRRRRRGQETLRAARYRVPFSWELEKKNGEPLREGTFPSYVGKEE